LAEAMRRPGVVADAELRLTDSARLATNVVLPDTIGTLVLKTLVRSVRNETRDAEDLWRCLEIAAAARLRTRLRALLTEIIGEPLQTPHQKS
jgi:hypothetical protein